MGVSANTTHQDPDLPPELQQRPAWTGGPTVAILCSASVAEMASLWVGAR